MILLTMFLKRVRKILDILIIVSVEQALYIYI